MSNSTPFCQLDKLICEYEEDTKTIRADKLIILNYPKLFVMSSASLFEHYIKNSINDFIISPSSPISRTYPNLHILLQRRSNKPITDNIFAKLEGYENNGVETLNADPFFNLFGGQAFKNNVENNFNTERSNHANEINTIITGLQSLIGQDNRYDLDYAKNSDIKDRLTQCTFDISEKAFLSLKLRRNRVAHNFISGLSDSFEDVRNFYYDARLYVAALQTTLENLTSKPT